mgnify:CR=1
GLMSVYSRVVDVYLVYLVCETHDLTRLTLNYPLGGSTLAVMPDGVSVPRLTR